MTDWGFKHNVTRVLLKANDIVLPIIRLMKREDNRMCMG